MDNPGLSEVLLAVTRPTPDTPPEEYWPHHALRLAMRLVEEGVENRMNKERTPK